MSTRIATYMGAPAIAGLGWERSPDRLPERAMGLRWGTTFAPLDAPEHIGKPSLLSLLYAGLPEGTQDQTLLIAYADAASETYFGALVSNAEPVLEAEHLFEERSALLNWMADECAQDGLDGLALSAELVGAAKVDVPLLTLSAPPDDFDPVTLTGTARRMDLSSLSGGGSKRALNITILGAAAIGALIYSFGLPDILSLGKPKEAEPVAMTTIFERRDERAFLESCAGAFEETWAIGPGWIRDVAGCTGPGMSPVNALPAATTAAAFQIYRLNAGWDVSVARRAARLVLEAGGDAIGGTADTLIVTRPLSAPLVQRAQQTVPLPTNGIQGALEAAFLGRARAVRARGPDYEITLWGGIKDMTETLAGLDWLEVASLERRGGLVTALVRQRRASAREIPTADLALNKETKQ